MPGEARLWNMKLMGYSADAIEWAFGEYLARVGVDIFFPKPGQIIGLCRQFYDERRQANESEETKRVLRDNVEIRKRLEAAGELSGLAQYHAIMKRALEINTPPPINGKRRAELRKQLTELQGKKAKTK
jgi:hypothetical protein